MRSGEEVCDGDDGMDADEVLVLMERTRGLVQREWRGKRSDVRWVGGGNRIRFRETIWVKLR